MAHLLHFFFKRFKNSCSCQRSSQEMKLNRVECRWGTNSLKRMLRKKEEAKRRFENIASCHSHGSSSWQKYKVFKAGFIFMVMSIFLPLKCGIHQGNDNKKASLMIQTLHNYKVCLFYWQQLKFS